MIASLILPALLMTVPPAPDVPPPPPLLPTPTARQISWHERGMYAFVHFNMNTFTDLEWGHGDERPETFHPTELDTDQWCRVFMSAGMTGVIITAKHHDGFCLWPSALTDHDVSSSEWRDGEGDVLRDLSESCARFGLDFGVYLSPWDRNHPLYGSGDAYNEFFVAQLREVLSNYGPIFEVWFDGANGEGPDGRRQVYDFDLFRDVVRELQPEACIFSDAGPDVRWIGNERGIVGETNWNLLKRDEFYPGIPGRNSDLNEGQADGTHWLPGEADVSIRPGWYYHASQDDQVKNLEQLLEIWYGSIGRGANLLLNFPVDRRGLVHENDAAAILELRTAIDDILREDLAAGRPATSEQTHGGDDGPFAAGNAVDGDPHTFWAAEDGSNTGTVEIALARPSPIDHVELREHLPIGQRIAAFSIQCRTVDGWTTVARGTTVGNRRILRFPTVMANRVRVVIEDARTAPTLVHIGVHSGPPSVEIAAESNRFLNRTEAYLAADRDGAAIHFTLDGTDPTRESPRHAGGPIVIDEDVSLRAAAFEGDRRSLLTAEAEFERFNAADVRSAALPLDHDFEFPGVLEVLHYDDAWERLDEIEISSPIGSSTTNRIPLATREPGGRGGLRFQGFLRIRKDGVYAFHLASDRGAGRLRIGHPTTGFNRAEGVDPILIPLATGWHPITLDWMTNEDDGALSLEFEGPGVPRREFRSADLALDEIQGAGGSSRETP